MSVQIQLRRGEESDWTTQAVAAGEPVLVTDDAKGPLLYIGVSGQNFSGLNAQVASFQPQGGGTTRYGHVVATDEDYTFAMLAAGDNARALAMASGGSFTLQSGSSMVVDDTATVDFDNVPDFNKGMIVYVGADDNSDGVVEGGTFLVKNGGVEVFKIDTDGNVTLQPSADGPNPALHITGPAAHVASGGYESPLVRITKTFTGTDVAFEIDQSGNVHSYGKFQVGDADDGSGHGEPTILPVVQSLSTPDDTDVGATGDQKDVPFFRLDTEGTAGDDFRGRLTLNSEDGSTAGDTAIQVLQEDSADAVFEVDYAGDVLMRDGAITQTGRTLEDDSLVRKDELLGTVLDQITSVGSTVAITNSDSSFPVGGIRAVAPSGDHSGTSFTVTMATLGVNGQSNISMQNAPTGKYLVLCWGTTSSSDRESVRDCESTVVDHITGTNETAFTLTNLGMSVWGYVMRLS